MECKNTPRPNIMEEKKRLGGGTVTACECQKQRDLLEMYDTLKSGYIERAA
jgi:hypothetical protein